MIKAVIFDADGVLINAELFSVQLARDYGIPTKTTLPFFIKEMEQCILGKADLKERLGPYLQQWGWTRSVDELLDYWFQSGHKIDADLAAYIRSLRKKGIRCYLATNQEKYRADYMLTKMGFTHLFDKVFASAHIGLRKPSHDFYETIYADMGNILKDEILFWDDDPENVEGAVAFGFRAELYTNFINFEAKMERYLRLA